ncbi:MAG: AAA family ATPase [Planctomycetota bacterium]
MISKVHVQNYRCLKSVDVDLAPLTVLIGENDTGKSSFLGALKNFQVNDWDNPENRRLGTERGSIRGWNERGDESERGVGIGKGATLGWKLDAIHLVSLPASGPAMTAEGTDSMRLGNDGAGVPALLDHFLRTDRERFDSYLREAKQRIRGLSDLKIRLADQNRHVALDLKLESGYEFSADQASAGVKNLLYFIALAHHPSPPDLLLLEEPENGLHPRRLSYVIRLLRALSKGEFAYGGTRPCQVVLSTHSPYLLDEIDPETEQVLVFSRENDGSRTAKAIDKEGLKVFLDEFKLGEVWFNEQEAGLTKP